MRCILDVVCKTDGMDCTDGTDSTDGTDGMSPRQSAIGDTSVFVGG